MKLTYCLLAILWPVMNSFAQNPAIRRLSIGDTVPDIIFTNIINYKSSSAKLSDFKGKLVIIDFWATWCGTCVSKFPFLDSTQYEQKDKIQILLVNSLKTHDTKEKIQEFLKKYPSFPPGKHNRNFARGLSIPIIYSDTNLKQMFPQNRLPYYVFLSPDRKVLDITDFQGITREYLQMLIRKEHI